MKNLLIETKNVVKANQIIKEICSRNGGDLVVFYGFTGTGKSQLALKNFPKNDWGYYRIETKESGRSFLREVYRTLNFILTGNDIIPRGYSSEIAKECIRLFEEINLRRSASGMPPFVFFIDEVNVAFKFRKWDIVELLRDFRDKAGAKIVMIGEEDTKKKIESYDSHFSGRITNYCPFDILTREDIISIIGKTMEVEADPEVYRRMIEEMRGNLHNLESYIKKFEILAKNENLGRITKEDIKKYNFKFNRG